MPRKLLTVLSILAAALVLGVVGQMDYDDAQSYARYECEMIQAGHWPADVNPRCKEVAQ